MKFLQSDARTEGVPLYLRVRRVLQGEIESSLKAGDPLPPEPELERRFGVSRITVRRALDDLVTAGYIVRRQGRGTFVRERPIVQDLTRLLSWTASMRRHGYEPVTMEMEIEVRQAGGETRVLLGLEESSEVAEVRRLRGTAGEPICLMSNIIPAEMVPHIEHSGLVDDSIYATLAAHGHLPRRVEDTVEARAAGPDEAARLGVEPGFPLLRVVRLAFDAQERPIDLATVTNRADRFRYAVAFETDGSATRSRPGGER